MLNPYNHTKIITPYDTTACAVYQMDKIKNQLGVLLGNNGLTREGTLYILDNPEAYKEIDSFGHPVLVENKLNHQQCIVIDARNYYRFSPAGLELRDKMGYGILRNIGLMNCLWFYEGTSYLRNIGSRTARCYGRWLASTITKRYGLTPADYIKIEIIAAAYFLNQFNSGDYEWTEHNLIPIYTKLTENGYAIDDIKQALSFQNNFKSLEDLVEAIKEQTENIRLESFSVATLFALISNTWMGHNRSELTAVALEHVPTFLTIIYYCLKESLYRKTGIASIAQDVMRREQKEFINTYEKTIAMYVQSKHFSNDNYY